MYILDLPDRLSDIDPFVRLLIVIISLVAVGLVVNILSSSWRVGAKGRMIFSVRH